MSNIFDIVNDIKEFNELYVLAKSEEEAFIDTLESLKTELADISR